MGNVRTSSETATRKLRRSRRLHIQLPDHRQNEPQRNRRLGAASRSRRAVIAQQPEGSSPLAACALRRTYGVPADGWLTDHAGTAKLFYLCTCVLSQPLAPRQSQRRLRKMHRLLFILEKSSALPNLLGSGVFEREWSKATVQMDCGSWAPAIKWKGMH